MRKARGLAVQLVLSHGAVALLGCAFLAGLLALLLPGVYVNQRQEVLVDKAQDLAEDIAPWLAGVQEQPNFTIAALEARGLKVVDTEWRLLARSNPPRKRHNKARTKAQSGLVMARMALTETDRIWQRRWRAIMAGQIVRGTFGLPDGDQALVVAVPARYRGRTVGAVIVNTRLADLRGAEGAMLPVIGAAAAAAALAAVLAGVALSRRMARPMQRMTQAAERVAAGDLEVHVEPPSWHEGESLALAFNRMTKVLAAQERARRQFIADASHQLRAPLTSLQAQTEALLDDVVTDEAKRRSFIARIAEDTKRLAILAQQLLDLERLDAAETAPNRQPVDIGSLLRSVADAFQDGESATLVVEPQADAPHALADPNEVRQALINLLDNALKHTAPAKTVRLWARAEGDGVRLGVTDQGEGIAAEHLQRVWDRFYRVPRDSSPGTGLGLAIAKRLIERQSGTVSAESTPGGGSTFSFTLPRA
jgi:signal transduction histidine kinase